MAIQQERAPEAINQKPKQVLDRVVIGAVRLVQPFLQLRPGDRPAPKIAVLRRAGRDDAKTASRPGAQPVAPGSVDDRWVQLVFGAVAIDGRTRGPRNHGADAPPDCPPRQPVDQGVFETCEGWASTRGHSDQPIRIIAARMGHGQQYRQLAARRMDDWGGEWAHFG